MKHFTLLCKVPSKVGLCMNFNMKIARLVEYAEGKRIEQISSKSTKVWLRYKENKHTE